MILKNEKDYHKNKPHENYWPLIDQIKILIHSIISNYSVINNYNNNKKIS